MQRYTFNMSATWTFNTGVQSVTVLADNVTRAIDALTKFADNTEQILFHIESVTTDVDVSEEARKRLR